MSKILETIGKILVLVVALGILFMFLLVIAIESYPAAFGMARGPGGYLYDQKDYDDYIRSESDPRARDFDRHFKEQRDDFEAERNKFEIKRAEMLAETKREFEISFMREAKDKDFQEWLNGFVSRGGDPKNYNKANTSNGWYVVQNDFRTEILSNGVTALHINNTFIVDGNVDNVIVPKNVSYLGGGVGKDINLYVVKSGTVIKNNS